MLLQTRSGHRASQRADELREFIDLLRRENARRYLEIGARHGDTFFDVMMALPEGSFGVAVDWPGAKWGKGTSRAALEDAVQAIKASGRRAHAVFGDSRSMGIRQMVMVTGPYDAVFIDGDHTYDGVFADWQNYGPMARMVAFHDIDGEGQIDKSSGFPVQVPTLWREIRDDFRHVEIIGTERGMGIGVLWRE